LTQFNEWAWTEEGNWAALPAIPGLNEGERMIARFGYSPEQCKKIWKKMVIHGDETSRHEFTKLNDKLNTITTGYE